jgi:hypothetical protein
MRIAILCRPDDAPGYDLRVAAQLRALVPDAVIQHKVANADLVLVLIGPAWADSPPDPATVADVEAAIAGAAKVVPTLVQKGRVPPAHLLQLRHASFAADLQRTMDDVGGDRGGPWSADVPTGTLRIVSHNPGTLRRAFGKWDSGGPVSIKVDGIVVATMHLFGDETAIPLAPGPHEVLVRWRFEKPVQVDVPVSGTVDLHVTRNLITGGVRIDRQAR